MSRIIYIIQFWNVCKPSSCVLVFFGSIFVSKINIFIPTIQKKQTLTVRFVLHLQNFSFNETNDKYFLGIVQIPSDRRISFQHLSCCESRTQVLKQWSLVHVPPQNTRKNLVLVLILQVEVCICDWCCLWDVYVLSWWSR